MQATTRFLAAARAHRWHLPLFAASLLLAACGPAPQAPADNGEMAPPTASTAPAARPAPLPTPPARGSSRLESMSIAELLAAARDAYAQHRVVAPAGDNAVEYYEAVLAKDQNNRVAKDALRETFPFGVQEVDKSIARGNLDEARREIDLLAHADPTNYSLTLLRTKLDAQQQAAEQRQNEQQLKAQRDAALAAQQAAAKLAAEQAAQQQATQQATARTAAAAKPETPAEPTGITRPVRVVKEEQPDYPVQAARSRTAGYAVVEFSVTAQGTVTNVRVIDSQPRRVFDNAAMSAVRKSQYEPAMQNGQPITSMLTRRITFKLGGG